MGTLLQPQKQIKSVALSQPPKSRLKGDSVASFQARCASALRLALPKELKAHGAVMPMVDVDAMGHVQGCETDGMPTSGWVSRYSRSATGSAPDSPEGLA